MTRDQFKAECKAAKLRLKGRYYPRFVNGVMKLIGGRMYHPRHDGWRRATEIGG